MTYRLCKRLIELKDFDEEALADFKMKLDVFLLHDRITQKEYDELIGSLDAR